MSISVSTRLRNGDIPAPAATDKGPRGFGRTCLNVLTGLDLGEIARRLPIWRTESGIAIAMLPDVAVRCIANQAAVLSVADAPQDPEIPMNTPAQPTTREPISRPKRRRPVWRVPEDAIDLPEFSAWMSQQLAAFEARIGVKKRSGQSLTTSSARS